MLIPARLESQLHHALHAQNVTLFIVTLSTTIREEMAGYEDK